MSGRSFSVILLPTLDCNAACDYCFEEKSRVALGFDDLPRVTASLLDHMERIQASRAEIYWQGGEALLLGPAWYERAHEVMSTAAAKRGLSFTHFLQSNLIGFGRQWDEVVRTMFGGAIGTSMDYPNLHRRLKDGSAADYTRIWLHAVAEARAAGFGVSVIAVLHAGSLRVPPMEFLQFFSAVAGVSDLQVNLPFPGGPSQGGETLDSVELARFLEGLIDASAAEEMSGVLRLAPFDSLVRIFAGEEGRLPCIWQPNCAGQFVSVDARGHVALCDCWVTSYPQFRFGNLFETPDLTAMLDASPARRRFLERPAQLMDLEDCDACRYLSLCHGGCPVRTFSAKGTILAKDPYCEVYQAVFDKCRAIAAETVRRRSSAAGRAAAVDVPA